MLNMQTGPNRGSFNWRWWSQSRLEDCAQISEMPMCEDGWCFSSPVHGWKKMATPQSCVHEAKIEVLYDAGKFSSFFYSENTVQGFSSSPLMPSTQRHGHKGKKTKVTLKYMN